MNPPLDFRIVAGEYGLPQKNARTAFEFETTTPTAEGSLGGVIDSLLWNTFASSDGSIANQALDVVPVYGGPVPYIDEINDLWQDYFGRPDAYQLF